MYLQIATHAHTHSRLNKLDLMQAECLVEILHLVLAMELVLKFEQLRQFFHPFERTLLGIAGMTTNI